MTFAEWHMWVELIVYGVGVLSLVRTLNAITGRWVEELLAWRRRARYRRYAYRGLEERDFRESWSE